MLSLRDKTLVENKKQGRQILFIRKLLISALRLAGVVAFLFVFATTGFATPAPSRPTTLAELRESLAAHPTVHCRFTQERRIKGLARPLKSSGELRVSHRDGLLWKQEKPFAMTLTLDEKRMVQEIAGQPQQVVTAEQNPQLFQFNHILGALFQGDPATLEKNFTVTFVAHPEKSQTSATSPPAASSGAVVPHRKQT